MLTAYCMSYEYFTVIPKQWHESFSEMRDMGFDAVALTFSESEMRYSRRAFEAEVAMAHKLGLKVFVIPSRLGGRFAGAPLMHCLWLSMHPECQVPGHPELACIEAEPFVEWMHEFMGTLIGDYELDGIVWDEIKRSGLVSTHPATLKKFGHAPSTEEAQDSFVEFLDDLTTHCMKIRPELTVTMFNSATAPEYFTAKAARIPHFHYCGYDGNFCEFSFYKEKPHQDKYLLGDAWARTVRECAAGGKKTFALVENFCVPKSEHDIYRKNLDSYLSAIRLDHLAIYYYGLNNECPEEVHQMTKELLKKYHHGKQYRGESC
jgi:hypothetical protein